jgi:hypothetical protein
VLEGAGSCRPLCFFRIRRRRCGLLGIGVSRDAPVHAVARIRRARSGCRCCRAGRAPLPLFFVSRHGHRRLRPAGNSSLSDEKAFAHSAMRLFFRSHGCRCAKQSHLSSREDSAKREMRRVCAAASLRWRGQSWATSKFIRASSVSRGVCRVIRIHCERSAPHRPWRYAARRQAMLPMRRWRSGSPA